MLPILCSGNYTGGEAERLTALKYAALLGAAFVDVELKAAAFYFAGPLAPQSCSFCCQYLPTVHTIPDLLCYRFQRGDGAGDLLSFLCKFLIALNFISDL